MQTLVNCKKVEVPIERGFDFYRIDYRTLVAEAGFDPDRLCQVVFTTSNGYRGHLRPGQRCMLFAGTTFEVFEHAHR